MLRRDLGPVTVMGFARYRLNDGVDPVDLIAAARKWQSSFLGAQPGIAMHCFLGNLKGQFADAILATDEASFGLMAEAHPSAAASAPLMQMLDMESLSLTLNHLLGEPKQLPKDFSCIEFGTFKPKEDNAPSEAKLMAASDRIERNYLPGFSETRAHFMGRIDDSTFSEIAFVETTGAAREICNGYVGNPNCTPLLDLFDPASVDLDFWHVLA